MSNTEIEEQDQAEVEVPDLAIESVRDEAADLVIESVKDEATTWGPKLFYGVLIAVLVFFWWMVIYPHGVVSTH